MNIEEQTTWNILRDLKIDEPSSPLKFSDRLASENGWTKTFALEAITEYKKFVFLAKHAGHPITPSVEVDEVWHLHLIYTRSYWGDMCKSIGFELHHGPTKGGKSESDKFNNWYEKTLESYERFFGKPPVKYWPSSKERFKPSKIKKVDFSKNFVFRRPLFSLSHALPCVVVPIILLMTDMTAGLLIAGGIVALWLLIAYIVKVVRKNNEKRSRTSSSSISGNSNDSGCGTSYGWIFFSCGGCGSSSSDHNSSSGCGSSSSDSSGCGSSCGSSCGGGCGGGD
jgi:hypothetical protein